MVATSLIFSGGPSPKLGTLNRVVALDDIEVIIAVDSGLHTAQQLGYSVNVVIGDMDSVDQNALKSAQLNGSKIIRLDSDKDLTDLHCAVLHAVTLGTKRIVIVTAGGGRLDHQLGVLGAMFDPALCEIEVVAIWGDSTVTALQGPGTCSFNAELGEIVGLQTFGKSANQITTRGLRWHLNNETLEHYQTRGVSNEVVATNVKISISSGNLLIIHQNKDSSL